jgi:hypothetical protein
MEPKWSLSCSQKPATCHYAQPDKSSPKHPIICPKIHFNVILPPIPRSSKLTTHKSSARLSSTT